MNFHNLCFIRFDMLYTFNVLHIQYKRVVQFEKCFLACLNEDLLIGVNLSTIDLTVSKWFDLQLSAPSSWSVVIPVCHICRGQSN